MTRALWAAYAAYLVSLAYVVLSPQGTAAGQAVLVTYRALGLVGLDVAPALVEPALNVILFVPLSLLGGYLFRAVRLGGWVLAGAAVSALVETLQLVIPGRVPTFLDVVANTAGALLGAVLARGFLTADDRDAVRSEDDRFSRSGRNSPL